MRHSNISQANLYTLLWEFMSISTLQMAFPLVTLSSRIWGFLILIQDYQAFLTTYLLLYHTGISGGRLYSWEIERTSSSQTDTHVSSLAHGPAGLAALWFSGWFLFYFNSFEYHGFKVARKFNQNFLPQLPSPIACTPVSLWHSATLLFNYKQMWRLKYHGW